MGTENREVKISKSKTSERSKDNENQRPDIEEKRVWTDLPWLIVFLLMTVAWLVVMVYSLVTGNPARLSLPTNSLGQLELSVLRSDSCQWAKCPARTVNLLDLDLRTVRLVTVQPRTAAQPEERSDGERHDEDTN